MADTRDATAREGERLAARELERKGYVVVGRRVRTRLGEIDLVVEKGELVVFVEVKTRRSGTFGAPAEAVGSRKAGAIRRSATLLLASRPRLRGRPSRIDIVEVLLPIRESPIICHLEDALDGGDGIGV